MTYIVDGMDSNHENIGVTIESSADIPSITPEDQPPRTPIAHRFKKLPISICLRDLMFILTPAELLERLLRKLNKVTHPKLNW